MNFNNNNTEREILQMTDLAKLLELFRSVPVLSVQYINHKLALNSPRKVISDLRKKGYDIKDRWAEHIRPDGSTVRYKEYWLVPGDDNDVL